jgi:quercetin dioxygenase-like cupin family protein
VLVSPPRLGDPVFNHLHFPAGIKQSQHTHPSIRLGVIARGRGHAWGEGWQEELSSGCVFMLEEHEMHSFRTDESGNIMDVIAYHPDSQSGPSDQNHPMVNRTYIAANAFRHGVE